MTKSYRHGIVIVRPFQRGWVVVTAYSEDFSPGPHLGVLAMATFKNADRLATAMF